MDPATLFLVYLVAILGLWLLATAMHPAIDAVSRAAAALPIGRRFAAVVISVGLVGSAGAARASVEPPNTRMVQMVDTAPSIPAGTMSIVHRPMMASASATYTVVSGDSLWKIARSVLDAGGSVPSGSSISDLWRSIYTMNRDLIGDDPNLIHPGQVLQLPGR